MKRNVEQKNFYNESLFSFDSNSSISKVESIYSDPTCEPKKIWKIGGLLNKKVKFVFVPSIGLARLNGIDGSIDEKNILGDFLAIKNADVKSFFSFFEKNGFLFPISNDKFEEINFETITKIKENLENLTKLMNLTCGNGKKNYDLIFKLVSKLIFRKQENVSLSFSSFSYSSYNHRLQNELERIENIEEKGKENEKFNLGVIPVADTIFDSFNLDFQIYNNSLIGEYKNEIDKSITYLYVNDLNCNRLTRQQIDFFFHYFNDNVLPDEMSDTMKLALIDISKEIIKEEIDWNVEEVHACFDKNTMTPKWKINSLLTGMYFSLFYMKPNIELMKQCENPRCGKYFKVQRTTSKRKYCCDQCRNRALQSRHRQKIKESN